MVPTLTNLMGTHGLFYLYSVLTLFVAFICSFAMPDTSGLSLEEIENIYKKKQKSEKWYIPEIKTVIICTCNSWQTNDK